MSETQYLSEEGLIKVKKELESLKTAKRKEISQRIEEAKKLGDLSENSEYMEAKEAQEINEKRIAELEEIIKNAAIIKQGKVHSTVQIGSRVEVASEKGKKEFMIVGSEEADPVQGKISNASPMGRAFLGRKVGDNVIVKTPAGEVKYEVLGIK